MAAAQRRVAFVFVLPLFFLYLPVCAKFRLATPTNRNQPPPINAIYEHSVVELRVRSLKERKRKERKKKEDERETTAAWLRFVKPLQTKMPARFSGVNKPRERMDLLLLLLSLYAARSVGGILRIVMNGNHTSFCLSPKTVCRQLF